MTMKVGIIAEDRSDINAISEILKNATKRKHTVKGIDAKGCGRIHSKCAGWAKFLHDEGCSRLLLLHDLDDKVANELLNSLRHSLGQCPIQKYLILVPVRELEAWLLADHEAVNRALNLKVFSGKVANPESIRRPKEYLRDKIYSASGRKVSYVTTVHNPKIANNCRIKELSRCRSFLPLKDFIEDHL